VFAWMVRRTPCSEGLRLLRRRQIDRVAVHSGRGRGRRKREKEIAHPRQDLSPQARCVTVLDALRRLTPHSPASKSELSSPHHSSGYVASCGPPRDCVEWDACSASVPGGFTASGTLAPGMQTVSPRTVTGQRKARHMITPNKGSRLRGMSQGKWWLICNAGHPSEVEGSHVHLGPATSS
jgi:hypothetical protein